jgi:hypothetical protein
MPIDPAALRARAAALAEQAADPQGLAAAVRALLDDYAERAHRVSPALAGAAPTNAYKAPAPVVRAVVAALRRFAKTSPHAALDDLRALWAGGSREERRIAAELLGVTAPHAPEPALALIETWLLEIESGETAAALAEKGLAPLLLADPAARLRNVQRWATLPQKWARCFALAALGVLARHPTWEDVPGALDVIAHVMGEGDPDVRKAAAEAISALIPKSTVEVSRFLREQAARVNHNTHLIVRGAMRKLPAAEQAEIIRVMRA